MVNGIARFLNPSPDDGMPRPNHPKSQLATTISPALHAAVRDFSEASGIAIAKIVEHALRAYLRGVSWPVARDSESEGWKGGHRG